MLFINGSIVNGEVEADEVVVKGKGHTVGDRKETLRDILERSDSAEAAAILALNEILGIVPKKEVIEISREVIANITANINKNALKYESKGGRGQKEVKQVKKIVGYDRNGLAILK